MKMNSQTLTSFVVNATDTLDRLNQSDQPEMITVDGVIRAVLLSPGAYAELQREAQLARDTVIMRQAVKELKDGNGRDSDEFFADLRAQLLALKPSDSGHVAE
jgi:PHD/YefM family antitoxin component YafN of YafNO toxin-antitoxin module